MAPTEKSEASITRIYDLVRSHGMGWHKSVSYASENLLSHSVPLKRLVFVAKECQGLATPVSKSLMP